MPTYVITGPDGKKYRVSGQGTPEEALSAVQQQVGGATPQAAPEPTQIAPEMDLITQKATALADYQEKIGYGYGAGDLFKNQFAFGLGDKIAGVAGAFGGGLTRLGLGKEQPWTGASMSEDYAIGRKAEEILEQRAKERTGARGTAAEIGGAILTGSFLRAPAAATAGARILQTGKDAAKLGTIQGVGNSEADSLTGVAGDALTSGALSGVLGAGLQGGLEVARPLIKGATAVGRSVRGLTDNTDARAARRVAQALEADNMTVGKAAGRMQRSGTSLINVADENTMGLGRAAAARPGPGRTMLNRSLDAQQATRATRAMGAIDDGLGKGTEPFNRQVASMIQQRGGLAKKAYNKVYNLGDKEIWTPELESLSSSPSIKQAMQTAVSKWRDRSIADGFGAMNPSASVERGILKFKNSGLPAYPNIQFWDYTKQALDDQIQAAIRAGAKNEVSALTSLSNKLRNELDAVVPIYKVARQGYASQSKLIEALERGREIMKPAVLNNLDQLADDFAQMSAPQKDMMRLGLSRALEDSISSTPDQAGNVINKIFGTPQKREAIKTLFKNDTAFRKFEMQMRQLAKEAGVFKNIRTGSRTSFVDAEKEAASNVDEVASSLMDMAARPVNATIRGLSKLLIGRGNMDPETAAKVAQILISQDPSFVMKALSAQTNTRAGQQAFDQLMSRAFRAVRGGTAALGAAAGSQAITSGQ
jgi:hypothetical protein